MITPDSLYVLIPLLLGTAVVSWRLRGCIEKGGRNALTEMNSLLEARRQLAQDRNADLTAKLTATKARLETLEAQINGTIRRAE